MKSIFCFVLSLFIFIKIQAQKNHIFLVKTDLTKEQIEQLLNENNQENRNGNPIQGETTSLKHKNSTIFLEEETRLHQANHESQTTQLHQINHEPEVTQLLQGNGTKIHQAIRQRNQTHQSIQQHNQTHQAIQQRNQTHQVIHQANQTYNHTQQNIQQHIRQANQTYLHQMNQEPTTQLKKKNKKEKESEVKEVSEIPEISEQTEEINLKKKAHKNSKNIETAEVTEIPTENTLLENVPTTEEIEESEVDTDTIILMNKNKEETTNVQQCSNKIFGFFSVILLTAAFVSLLIYSTQPKKVSELYKKRYGKFTECLLVKENNENDYEIRDF